MIIIGLTGGIASGKSTVANILQELGGIIVDADQLAHELIEPEKPAWKDIVKEFGPEVLDEKNYINRGKLGEIVFNHPEKLRRLNQISHPRVKEALEERIRQIGTLDPEALVVLEIALLLEAHMEDMVDYVWVVWVDEQTQMERLMARNHYNSEEALKRIRSQIPLNEKAKRADFVIDNNHTPLQTMAQTKKYFAQIKEKVKT